MSVAFYLTIGCAVAAYALLRGYLKMKDADNRGKVVSHIQAMFPTLDADQAISTAHVLVGVSVLFVWPLYIAIRAAEAMKGNA